MDPRIDSLIDEYAKSLTGETKAFEQFLIDYFETSPREAFKNLSKSDADLKTRQCAEDFNHSFVNDNLDRIQGEFKDLNIKPSTIQAKVIEGFYRDYFDGCDLNGAWENAQRQMNSDPSLRNDQWFQAHMKKIANNIKPQQKERKELNLQEDDGAFFKIRKGPFKRFEHKLKDYEVKKLLGDTLKKFYSSRVTGGKDVAFNVSHDVEFIFRQKQLPLALKLANFDTSERSKRTVSALEELHGNMSHIRKMISQGVKFKFTDAELQKPLAAPNLSSIARTATEKVDIVRDLIMDLNRRSVEDAFMDAVRTAITTGDKELLAFLKYHSHLLQRENTFDEKNKMLKNAYKLYVRFDEAVHEDDIKFETQNLVKGVKNEIINVALDELRKKGEALGTANEYNRFFQKAIHSIPQDEIARDRIRSVKEEVEIIAKKTSIRVDLENASAQPPPSQDQRNDKGLGAILN